MAAGFTLEWHDKELLKKVNIIADAVAKKGAGLVLKDARRLVPVDSETLKKEIEVHRGKFRDGDWVVEAQGPGNYTKFYAKFVELGHYSSVYGKYKRSKGGGSLKGISPIHIPKKPYLRPALNKNKSRIQRMFRDAMK